MCHTGQCPYESYPCGYNEGCVCKKPAGEPCWMDVQPGAILDCVCPACMSIFGNEEDTLDGKCECGYNFHLDFEEFRRVCKDALKEQYEERGIEITYIGWAANEYNKYKEDQCNWTLE